jgi:hypothetical protein
VKERVRNGLKKKEIKAFLLGHNGTATGGQAVTGVPRSVEEEKRLLLAGSKLSGKVPEKLGAVPERLPTGSGQVGINWNRTITTHDSTELLNCQVILLCSMRSNGEK